MNVVLQISLQDSAFNSFQHGPSRNTGSYSNSTFNVLRNHHTDFHVAVPDHVPTNSVQMFQFLHSLTNIYVAF